jgi:hypothetical protein
VLVFCLQDLQHLSTSFRQGGMPFPLQFRQNSFNSPADTPRIISSSKSSQPSPSLLPGVLSSANELLKPSSRKKEDKMNSGSDDVGVDFAESGSAAQFNKSPKALLLQESKHNSGLVEGKLVLGNASSIEEAGINAPPKPETPLHASTKSATTAAEAAEKASRMAMEFKALIGTQAQLARFQAVQAASSQKIGAEAEHEKNQKALESAYMRKVEEAAVLRRECANLQEIVGALKLNLRGAVGQLPAEKETSAQDGGRLNSHNFSNRLDDGIQVHLICTHKDLCS